MVCCGKLLTFLAAVSPIEDSLAEPHMAERSDGVTDEISISALPRDHSGRHPRHVGRRVRVQRPHQQQPQRAHRAGGRICQGRDAAGWLQGERHRLPAGLVQNSWWRRQRLGQFRLSLAGPCRSPAGDHRAPAASSAALAASAAPSSAPSPTAQTASRELQDRTRFLLQIANCSGVTRQDVVPDRNHRLRYQPVQPTGFRSRQRPSCCQEPTGRPERRE